LQALASRKIKQAENNVTTFQSDNTQVAELKEKKNPEKMLLGMSQIPHSGIPFIIFLIFVQQSQRFVNNSG